MLASKENMKRVEAELRRHVDDDWAILAETLMPLVMAGGKRLRPSLVLEVLTACSTGDNRVSERAISAAVTMELLHLGSLIHDDVIDQGTLRRGVPTMNAQFGNLRAVLGGDVLFARATAIAADLGVDHSHLVAETLEGLCRGQTHECTHLFDITRDESSYFTAVEGKTGVLMGACCQMGALESPLARHAELRLALGRFGRQLGVAFQILDDVLDLIADAATTGKTRGKDLSEGVYTLPVIYALEGEPRLTACLRETKNEDDLREVVELVVESPGPERALAVAREYAYRCINEIGATAGDDIEMERLRTITDYVLYPLSLDIETWAPENLRYSDGGGAAVVAGRN